MLRKGTGEGVLWGGWFGRGKVVCVCGGGEEDGDGGRSD